MTTKPKIVILLPDGIGLRNFAYSEFHTIGEKENFDLVFWNNTPFDLTTLGFTEIKIGNSKSHPLTETYKNARKQIELNLNIRRTKDRVYDTYRFPFSYTTVKKAIKSSVTQIMTFTHSSQYGLTGIRKKIKRKERKTLYYHQCLETLQKGTASLCVLHQSASYDSYCSFVGGTRIGYSNSHLYFLLG